MYTREGLSNDVSCALGSSGNRLLDKPLCKGAMSKVHNDDSCPCCDLSLLPAGNKRSSMRNAAVGIHEHCPPVVRGEEVVVGVVTYG